MKKFLFLLSLVILLHQGHSVLAEYDDDELDLGGLSRDSFPKGFIWGVAASAYQVEGMTDKEGRKPCIWDKFITDKPDRIANYATANVTVDEYHRYKADIDMIEELNFDSYRFSISWSRIFPDGEGRVNWLGVDYYNRLIDYMLAKGITPYANLYHYDLPQALADKYNGWLSKSTVKAYVAYADFCFKMFGDRVKFWFTFNEPRVAAALGYDNGIHAPGRCSKEYGNCTEGNSGTEPYIVAHHFLLSHAGAVQRYRQKYQKDQHGKIGILLDFVWYEPLTNSVDDELAAKRARDFHIGWFLHPITYGRYPDLVRFLVGDRLPKFSKREEKMVKGSIDLVGINHYTSYYIYDSHESSKREVPGYQADWSVGFAYDRDGVPIGPRAYSDWLYIVPWGMYKVVTYVKENYGNPIILLSENGMDDPGNVTLPAGLHDTKRLNYYKGYLTELSKAIKDGANVIGYHAWSILDNFEWLLGYSSRFGIVYVDRKNHLKRYPKMSARWFQKLLERN
ncbi:hypothetical protein MRB53_017260 [Persea americana]|uniref:Uncharacterized protein n=1 Tax=Persea americana TaxID=3435 RepID=A0ACC2M5F1_PERAE|nr:hypothetical protein MRB53_017260 [Persea americana]